MRIKLDMTPRVWDPSANPFKMVEMKNKQLIKQGVAKISSTTNLLETPIEDSIKSPKISLNDANSKIGLSLEDQIELQDEDE